MVLREADPIDGGGGGGGGGPRPGPIPGPTPLPNPVSPRPIFTDNEELELLSPADIGRPIPLAYGQHLVGGKVFVQHELQTGTDKGKTILFVALGVGEWNKTRALFVNGKLVDKTDTSKFHFHPGKAGEVGAETDPATPNQKTCSFWPSDFTQQPNFPGIAYASMKLDPDIEAPGPGFQVVGVYETLLVRIFDNVGTQTSYEYSSNPSWIALDEHIRAWIAPTKTNGETLSTAEKDKIDFQAFKDWADDSDFVTPQGTKRWEAHYALTQETDLMRALELSHLLGRAYTLEKNGKIAPFMDKARTPLAIVKAAHFHESSYNLGRRSLRDAANRIEVKYRDLDSGKGAGTISTTGVNVTGTGTDFTKLYKPGEPCDLRDGAQAGEVQAVKSVASATSMVLKTAFSVNQTGAAYGNPAQDFNVKTFIKEDTTLQGQVGRVITATFDLGNSIPERAERIATFLLDRTTKLVRQTGYRLLLGQASSLDHLAGDVLTSPDDVSFDPANTRDFEVLEVTVQPDGSVEVAGQEYQDIFSDAASAGPAQEISLPPRPPTSVPGGFQVGAVFVPDQLNGASNPGEIDFDPLPNQDHTFWRLPDGTTFTFPAGSQFVSQAAQETHSGRVYVIFSKDLCNSVRGLAAFQDSHILVLRWNNGSWQYDNNTTWVAFTPVASDICLFDVQRGGGNWAADPARWIGQELLSHVTPRERVGGLTDQTNIAAATKIGGDSASRADDTDTGATRGRNALDSIFKLTTGTTLQTVAQLGDAHDRAVGAIDATNIIVAGGINFTRAYTNKNQDNIPAGATFGPIRLDTLTTGRPDLSKSIQNKTLQYILDYTAGDRRASTLNEKTGGTRGFNALNSVNELVTGTTNKTVAQLEDGVNRATTGLNSSGRAIVGTTNRTVAELEAVTKSGVSTGILASVRFASANPGEEVLIDIIVGSNSSPPLGWLVAGTALINVPEDVASVKFTLSLGNASGSGSRTWDDAPNVGFSITAGAGPATPQVSGASSSEITQNSPVVGDGLTLTFYRKFKAGTFVNFTNGRLKAKTIQDSWSGATIT